MRRSAQRAAAIAAVTLAGCTAPERLPVFDVNWERAVERAAATPPPLPEPPGPVFEGVPDLAEDADGPVELSVEQAAFLALARNRDLAVQQLTPVIAGSFELIERGVFDPELFGEAAYDRQTASEVDRGTGAQFPVEGEGTSATAGVRQRLPSGTNVELGGSVSRDTSSRSPEQQEARVGLTVTQALLRGFGPAVNLVDLRQAQLDTLASVYELRGFAEALLAEVESTYWGVVLAAEEIGIFERSLAVAEQQLEDVGQRVDVGVLPPTERAAAEAEVALRQQALIDARSDLESRQLRLLRLIDAGGTDLALERELRLTSAPAVEAEPIDDLADRLALAERLRPDLAEARLRLERDRLETIVTRNGLLPRLDLFATIGKTGYADVLGDALANVAREDTYDFNAGVRLSYFLGNDAARGRNRAAFATALQAAAAVENLRQLVRLDVRLAAIELERARQLIAASAKTRALQEATVAAERERFGVGASTSLLVAQAQRDLLAAQIAEVEATIAYRLALIELYRAEGSLLERRGVRISP